jgi:hypothetical protein
MKLLPEDEQNIARAKIRSIIESDPLLSDREVIEFPYVTELHLVRKARLNFLLECCGA